MTRAELMRYALSQALRRVHVGPKKLKLDEETRWQIASEAVEELYGGWKDFFPWTLTQTLTLHDLCTAVHNRSA